MPNGSEWPKISIVTPSYNQGQFIEETIRSVLLQGYPNLEYIIIDGGSTDNSIEIVKRYEQHLAYWISEPDRGQSHAINKGFKQCIGDYVAWMNSDDCYMPEALKDTFNQPKPNFVDLIYGCTYIGESLEKRQLLQNSKIKHFDLKKLLRFFYSVEYVIPSQSVFVSKYLLKRVGLISEDLHYWMDLEWFARMALVKPSVYKNSKPICFYRVHNDAKTSRAANSSANPSREEAMRIAHQYAAHLPVLQRRKLCRLMEYADLYEKYQLGIREKSLNHLIGTMMLLPLETLEDRRFLGMLRRALTSLVLQDEK